MYTRVIGKGVVVMAVVVIMMSDTRPMKGRTVARDFLARCTVLNYINLVSLQICTSGSIG